MDIKKHNFTTEVFKVYILTQLGKYNIQGQLIRIFLSYHDIKIKLIKHLVYSYEFWKPFF